MEKKIALVIAAGWICLSGSVSATAQNLIVNSEIGWAGLKQVTRSI